MPINVNESNSPPTICHLELPLDEVKQNKHWKVDLTNRTKQQKTNLFIETDTPGQFITIDNFAVRCGYALVPGLRYHSKTFGQAKTGVQFYYGFADAGMLKLILNGVQTFCLAPIDNPQPMVINIPDVTEAIKLYVTLRSLKWNKAMAGVARIIVEHLKSKAITIEDFKLFCLQAPVNHAGTRYIIQHIYYCKKDKTYSTEEWLEFKNFLKRQRWPLWQMYIQCMCHYEGREYKEPGRQVHKRGGEKNYPKQVG